MRFQALSLHQFERRGVKFKSKVRKAIGASHRKTLAPFQPDPFSCLAESRNQQQRRAIRQILQVLGMVM